MLFRQRTFKRLHLVNHCFGDSVDAILRNQVGKLRGLDAIRRDVLAFHCELVGQADRPGAMRSCGSDKNLDVDRLAEAGKLFLTFRFESRIASGNIKDRIQHC